MDHEVGIWDDELPVDDLDWVGFGLIDDDLGLGPDDDDPEEDEAAAVVDELAPLEDRMSEEGTYSSLPASPADA